MTVVAEPKPKEQNIAIPETLHRRLKMLAASQGKKIKEIILPPLEALVSTEDGAQLKMEGIAR